MIRIHIYTTCFFAFFSLFSISAFCTPILATISESTGDVVTAWWPDRFSEADAWHTTLKARGIDSISITQMPNPPRLSPTVYGQIPLSNDNARALALLFGAKAALNGSVHYECSSAQSGVQCTAQAKLTICDGKNDNTFTRTLSSWANDEISAKNQLRTRLAVEFSPSCFAFTLTRKTIPNLIHKPVILFNTVPDADTLVAIRKRLKRVDGIADIAERFVANSTLAIEINPDQPELTPTTFATMIQSFISDTGDDFMLRETARSDSGILLEIVKY